MLINHAQGTALGLQPLRVLAGIAGTHWLTCEGVVMAGTAALQARAAITGFHQTTEPFVVVLKDFNLRHEFFEKIASLSALQLSFLLNVKVWIICEEDHALDCLHLFFMELLMAV